MLGNEVFVKYVFGPVPSRRLGQSLGIDPIPFKTCNWNCVYCQLGRSSPLVAERSNFFPPEEVVVEVESALAVPRTLPIDWLTFAGSGEPTLHTGLGTMIRRLKAVTPLPIAVITNGALLYDPQVREDLLQADAVLPTLDAGSERLYRRINRPTPGLDFDRYVDGLATFRREYRGQLWVEVMLVRGLNDTDEDLRDLAEILQRLQPDEVQLNSPSRACCEPWVHSVEETSLERAQRLLGVSARQVNPKPGDLDLSGTDDVVDAIVAIIQRHPISEPQLLHWLEKWRPEHIRETLADLEQSGRAQVVHHLGQRFWSYGAARYVRGVNHEHHRVTPPQTSSDS